MLLAGRCFLALTLPVNNDSDPEKRKEAGRRDRDEREEEMIEMRGCGVGKSKKAARVVQNL